VAVAVLTAFTALTAAQTSSQDYPQWRGRSRDGEAAAFVQPKTWPNALTLKWKVDVGPGNRVFVKDTSSLALWTVN
jgi:hypothetical protein